MGDMPAITSVLSSMERAPWGWVLMVAVLIALIKVWPIINLQVIKAREALRGEERSDLHDCRAEVAALDVKLTETIARVHSLEMKLFGTVTAYRILETDIETYAPQSGALMQARAVFREVWDVGPVPLDIVEVVGKV